MKSGVKTGVKTGAKKGSDGGMIQSIVKRVKSGLFSRGKKKSGR